MGVGAKGSATKRYIHVIKERYINVIKNMYDGDLIAIIFPATSEFPIAVRLHWVSFCLS